MEELKKRLETVPNAYDDFIAGVLCYAKKEPGHVTLLNDYLEDQNLSTVDILTFIINQPDFHKYGAAKLHSIG